MPLGLETHMQLPGLAVKKNQVTKQNSSQQLYLEQYYCLLLQVFSLICRTKPGTFSEDCIMQWASWWNLSPAKEQTQILKWRKEQQEGVKCQQADQHVCLGVWTALPSLHGQQNLFLPWHM